MEGFNHKAASGCFFFCNGLILQYNLNVNLCLLSLTLNKKKVSPDCFTESQVPLNEILSLYCLSAK